MRWSSFIISCFATLAARGGEPTPRADYVDAGKVQWVALNAAECSDHHRLKVRGTPAFVGWKAGDDGQRTATTIARGAVAGIFPARFRQVPEIALTMRATWRVE